MSQQVTSAYLDGIKEGRDFLKNFPSEAAMRIHSGVMKEFYKGQRDFWKNQPTRSNRHGKAF